MESIFLEGSDGVVNVHPLPIFAILDHHGRRKMNLDRVLGALLGRVNNGVIEVTDAFGVYHEEELKPGATIGDVRICCRAEPALASARRSRYPLLVAPSKPKPSLTLSCSAAPLPPPLDRCA